MGDTKGQAVGLKPFLERLEEGVVVCDGAMGTMLYSRGVFVNRCFDELNLSNPSLVAAVHAEYVEAGADVLETNTFGAHRLKLGPHGFDKDVHRVNAEGARIAREAAAGRALVAGSTGRWASRWSPSATSPTRRRWRSTASRWAASSRAAWTSSWWRRCPRSTRRGPPWRPSAAPASCPSSSPSEQR